MFTLAFCTLSLLAGVYLGVRYSFEIEAVYNRVRGL